MELSKFKRILTQVMVIPVLALLVLAGVLIWQIGATRSTVSAIERSDRRIALANLLGKLIVDEETGLRGFQTTGDAAFLEPYRKAEVPIQQAIAELRRITVLDNGAGTNLDHFVEAHRTWHDTFSDPLIAFIAAGGNANDVTLNLQGKQRMDAARASLDVMVHLAEQKRVERIALWNAAQQRIYYILILLALAMGLLIGLFTRDRLEAVSVAFRRSLEQERRRAEELFLSEQNLRTTLASIGDGVITCDADGAIRMMNLVAQELTGWSEAEAAPFPCRPSSTS